MARSNRQEIPFYSQLARAVAAAPARLSQTAGAEWSAWLKANAGKQHVRAEEIEWSGINDWLKLQDGKVSKEQVQQYLEQNGVKVEETTLGGRTGDQQRAKLQSETDAKAKAFFDQVEPSITIGKTKYFTDELYYELADGNLSVKDLPENLQPDAKAWFDSYNKLKVFEPSQVAVPKFGQYVVPGGENYREVLVTLPRKITRDNKYEVRISESPEHPFVLWNTETDKQMSRHRTEAEAQRYQEAGNNREDHTAPFYKSSHWEQPNVLAHVRLDDRTDADGKKVLFVQELQSDWGQQGKKEGFEPTEAPEWTVRLKEGGAVYRRVSSESDAMALIKGQPELEVVEGKRITPPKIPAAPFVTKTEGWLNLALKRVIKIAVDGGYDKVAFANGEQSAGHYDLGVHLKQISYNKNDDGTYQLLLRGNEAAARIPDQLNGINTKAIPETALEDMFGKEVSKKIVAGEGVHDGQTWDAKKRPLTVLSGLDLKVGGEGMKTFYDQIVPNATNTLLKKLGGDKMGLINLGSCNRWAIVNDATGERDYWYDQTNAEELARAGAAKQNKDSEILCKGLTFSAQFVDMSYSVGALQNGFTITDTMREHVLSKGIPLFQDERGMFDPETLTITLLQAADASTFIHEAGHFYLEVLADLAGSATPPKPVEADMKTIVEWFGIAGGVQAWSAMGPEEKRPYHEQFAKALESYVVTAQLPPQEILGPLGRARQWMGSVYKDLSELHGQLSPEICGVFDKLLSKSGAPSHVDTQHVRTALMSQLTAADRLPTELNAAYAALTARFYEVQAEAAGVSPKDLLRQYPLTIRSDVHGLAPGGIQKTAIESPEFKSWFRYSKIVNLCGEPLQVYHGTSHVVNQFDGYEVAGWFSVDAQLSGQRYAYGDSENCGPNIMPVYLSIQNPKQVDGDMDALGPNGRLLHLDVNQSSYVEQLIAQGYDGIAVTESGVQTYAVFDAANVKSVFNRGSWQQQNANILHQSALLSHPVAALNVASPPGALATEGLHVGPCIAKQGDFIGQKTGRDAQTLTWHAANKLIGQLPQLGEPLEIQYSKGIGTVKERHRAIER